MRRALVLLLAGCVLEPGGGGGTGGGSGGGGGGSENSFAKGFTFVRRDDQEVYVSDLSDFNTVFRVTEGGGAHSPSLSHDGQKIVFIHTTATDSEIQVVPSRGGATSTVLLASGTPSARNLRTPVFTPDGARVLFSYDDGASSSVGIVDVTGEHFTKVSPNDGLAYSGATLYPDGTAALAAAGGSLSMLNQLQRIDLSTLSATDVVPTLGNEVMTALTRVVVSPDGMLAALDGRVGSGSARIFVVDLSTQGVHQLTEYPGEPGAGDSSPCWMGQQVCFSSNSGGNDAAYALSADAMRTSGGLQLPAAIDPWFGPN